MEMRPSGSGQDLRGDVAADEFVAGGKYDFVAFDAEGAIEDDVVAFAVIALRILISFDDEEAALALVGARAGPE